MATSKTDFRPLMPVVREVAAALVEAGEIVVTPRGKVVDRATAEGPIHLSLAVERPR